MVFPEINFLKSLDGTADIVVNFLPDAMLTMYVHSVLFNDWQDSTGNTVPL